MGEEEGEDRVRWGSAGSLFQDYLLLHSFWTLISISDSYSDVSR